MNWLRNYLKWWIAADEMHEVTRWRVHCGEYDRWLASYPDIALVLQNLRGVAQGQVESWHGAPAEWGPVGIHALRQQVEKLRPKLDVEGVSIIQFAATASDDEELSKLHRRAAAYLAPTRETAQ